MPAGWVEGLVQAPNQEGSTICSCRSDATRAMDLWRIMDAGGQARPYSMPSSRQTEASQCSTVLSSATPAAWLVAAVITMSSEWTTGCKRSQGLSPVECVEASGDIKPVALVLAGPLNG